MRHAVPTPIRTSATRKNGAKFPSAELRTQKLEQKIGSQNSERKTGNQKPLRSATDAKMRA
jgi:hypothetical protein